MNKSQYIMSNHPNDSTHKICDICGRITDKGIKGFRVDDMGKGKFTYSHPDCHTDLQRKEEDCYLFNEGYHQGYMDRCKEYVKDAGGQNQ